MKSEHAIDDRRGRVGFARYPAGRRFRCNAARGKRRKAAMAGDTTPTSRRQDDDEFTQGARRSWARLIRRVYEVDPLLRPFCDAEMKILVLITYRSLVHRKLGAPGVDTMSIKAIAVGLLLLLPQLGFVWTDLRQPLDTVAVDWDAGKDLVE